MLYSIGYQTLKTSAELVRVLKAHGIREVLDVRSKPYSHNRAFNRQALSAELSTNGIGYRWTGDTLGGFTEIGEDAIHRLANSVREDVPTCLLCMEADPERCHRKQEIARRLSAYGVAVRHLTDLYPATAKEDPV